MKKILYSILAAGMILFTSCQKEEPGGTAVEAMAGQWQVMVDVVDDAGTVAYPDFNDGSFMLLTYNNNANDPDKLYVNDMGDFWDFTVQVPCDVSKLSFGSTALLENEAYPSGVTITDGKIVKNGTKTPSGSDADYIQFDVTFDDDDAAVAFGDPSLDGLTIAEVLGGTKYRVYGFRYTGLVNDEQ